MNMSILYQINSHSDCTNLCGARAPPSRLLAACVFPCAWVVLACVMSWVNCLNCLLRVVFSCASSSSSLSRRKERMTLRKRESAVPRSTGSKRTSKQERVNLMVPDKSNEHGLTLWPREWERKASASKQGRVNLMVPIPLHKRASLPMTGLTFSPEIPHAC